MICHHCGEKIYRILPQCQTKNLFIGMIHAFTYMGIPRYILTDNMKSVVIRRDLEGHPLWQKDYKVFMETIGFRQSSASQGILSLRGKVERLIRFVKITFLPAEFLARSQN